MDKTTPSNHALDIKARFFLSSFARRIGGSHQECPSCGCRTSITVAKKFGVTSLDRCCDCYLLFRSPTTPDEDFRRFYSSKYSQGLVTELPTASELEELKRVRFQGSARDYAPYIHALSRIGTPLGSKVLEFGCSWGYGCWQLREAGFDASGLEVKGYRTQFAEKELGIKVWDSADIPENGFDIFFTIHVLEHVPNLRPIFKLASRALKKGGLIVGIVPNGSFERCKTSYNDWFKAWGFVHPLLIDEVFLEKELGSSLRLVSSNYMQDDIVPDSVGQWRRGPLTGPELLFVARRDS